MLEHDFCAFWIRVSSGDAYTLKGLLKQTECIRAKIDYQFIYREFSNRFVGYTFLLQRKR